MNKRYRGIVFSLSIFTIALIIVFISNLGTSAGSKGINSDLQLINSISNQIRDLENDLFELKSNNYNENFNRGALVNSWTRLQTAIGDSIQNKLKESKQISRQDVDRINADWTLISGVFANRSGATSDQGPLRAIVSKVDRTDITLPQRREEAINQAIAGLRTSAILNHLDDIQRDLSSDLDLSFTISNGLQGIMIFAALAFWFLIYRFYLRRLSEEDAEMEEAQLEIDDIMNTVNEGLFLLDDNLNLGHQYSRALELILRRENIGQINLRHLLGKIVSPDEFATVNSFIKQLFNPRVKQKLIHDLNPLDRIKVNLERGDISAERWLSFHFTRVYKLGTREITKVLASVSDITRAVQLEQRLEKERVQSNQQVDLITTILRLDSKLMLSFVRSAAGSNTRINNILRRPHLRPADLRQKIDDIFREIHSLKGEASAMELNSFVGICTEVEEKLNRLKEKKNLSGDDFLPITLELESLISLTEQAELLVQRLGNVKVDRVDELAYNIDNINRSEAEILANHFAHYGQQVAQRQGKKVLVELLGFEDVHFDQKTSDGLREIITQMVRNAIVHGIEKPEQRLMNGKPETGNVMVELERDRQGYQLTVQDDGQGLNLFRLREKARFLPQFKDRDLSKVPEQELYRLIFMSGLSTAEVATEDAGQGVGLDLVRQRVEQLHGAISIRTKAGEFTRFDVRFPKP